MIQNEFYVYLYLRKDETPYYVGKGKNKRAYQKHQFVPVPKTDDRIIFVHTNLSEDDAFKKEIELISQYGRKNNGTGILRNLTDGGEGTSGIKWTPERRAAISNLTKKQFSSLESRSKHSKRIKESLNTPEYKEKHSKKMKEIFNTPEYKEKQSKKQKETHNTPEFKEKQSKIMKEIHNTPEYKEKQSKIMKEMSNRPDVKEKHKKMVNKPEVKAKRLKAFNETIAKRKAEKLQASANLTKFFISDPVSD